jgi:hypothetical protein
MSETTTVGFSRSRASLSTTSSPSMLALRIALDSDVLTTVVANADDVVAIVELC